MCTESPMSRPVRSISISLGMASARQESSRVWRTTFKTPPRLMPGDSSSLMKLQGTSTTTTVDVLTRRKSICSGRSFTGCCCRSRASTRSLPPFTLMSNRVVKKPPPRISRCTSWGSRVIMTGDFLAP
jgi:hypothetical protein